MRRPRRAARRRPATAPRRAPAKVRLGGMALRNGLLVHGPGPLGRRRCARRTARMRVESGRQAARSRGAVAELPGVRGIARLGEAFALLPADQAAGARGAAPVRGREGAGRDGRARRVLRPAFRRAGPARRRRRADGRRARASRPRRSRCATPSWPPTTAWSTRRSPATSRAPTPRDAAKEHDRCGSNLVAPMMISTVAGNVLVRSVLGAARAGRRASRSRSPAWRSRSRCSPGRSATARRALAHAFRRPGYEMQRLFATREPTTEQLEVGRAALAEILRCEAPRAQRDKFPSNPRDRRLRWIAGRSPRGSLRIRTPPGARWIGARMLPLAVEASPFMDRFRPGRSPGCRSS